MDSIFTAGRSADAVPIWFVTGKTYAELRERLDEGARTFADAAGFEPKAGRHLLLPARSGLGGVLFGLDDPDEARNDPFLPGRLPQILPDGVYRFANEAPDPRLAALAFALGSYRFTRYRKPDERELKLDLPQSLDRDELVRIVEAVTLARDLINTPANDMGPQELEMAAGALAARHGAKMSAVVGENLLAENFPLIHAVGRASVAAPRLIELQWGEADHPRVTLVGKGVCFDSGGLDIKPESAMLLMKKDMGGAASVLALAHMIMDRKLKVRLQRAHPGGRERDFRRRFPPARRVPVAQGAHGRGRQHRRRRAARPGRCARARRRGRAGALDRHGHADRRRARRARSGHAAVLYRGRCARRRGREPCRGGERSALAAAAVAALRHAARIRKWRI